MKQQMKNMPKKTSNSVYIICLIAALVIVLICVWAGYVCDETATKKGIQLAKVMKHYDEYLNICSFFSAIGKAYDDEESYSRKFALIGACIGFFIFCIFAAKTPKRYHRRGSEHGSAHWGSEKEKQLIRDNNDFYNNVIVASDVFLVLDRKARDKNEKKNKESSENTDKKDNKTEDKNTNIGETAEKVYNSYTDTQTKDGFILDSTGKTLIRCASADEITVIPDDIETIGAYAFMGNKVIKELHIKSAVTIDSYAFFGCEKLTTVKADTVQTINEKAFSNCFALDSIYLSGLKKAAADAFEKSAFTEIYAPKGCYAESFAYKNYVYYRETDKKEDNKKISVDSVLKAAEAAKKIKPMLNLNMIILGGSGTGKSRFFVKPNLMQCNSSFVVTDPSGELLQSCGKMLQREGYDIKVFNIDKMVHSCNYNPFHYLKESFSEDCTEKYKPENVIKMINVFMENTKGEGQSADPFWDKSTQLLISACVFYLLDTTDEDSGAWNWKQVLDLVHLVEVDENKPDKKSPFDILFDELAELMPSSLALPYYREFKQAAGKTMQSILINTTVRLQHFNLEAVQNLTYTDTIHLEELGDKKQALFIIIPSTDTTYNYLAAMMYTQLFDILYGQAMHKYKGHLKVPVRCILDEFANCGKIPEFDKVLATCRKFDISACVILQNLTQLKRIYEKSWEELPGNADTMLYLGGKDQFTNEYIMKSLGKETIDQQSINQTKGKQGSSSYNNAILGRELLQINELETMDNNDCIVMVRGLPPFYTPKYNIENHMRYNELEEVDPLRNTFDIKNVITEQKTVQLLIEDYTADNDVLSAKPAETNITMLSAEGDIITTEEEIRRSYGITDNELFRNVRLAAS